MATIFHLALASDWSAAQDAGAYTTSTRGRTLAEEGFIHASRGDQWPAIRDAFYADVTEPLLLLQIDTDRLDVPVIEERPAPGATETFPHIYGPIALNAVVKAMPVPAPASGSPAAPGDSFGRMFLSEMYVNAGLVILILLTTAAGLGAGNAVGGEVVPLVGLVAGVLAGCGLARFLYLRRHAA